MAVSLLSRVALRRALLGVSLVAAAACSSSGDSPEKLDSTELNPQPDIPRDLREQSGQGGHSATAQREQALQAESSAGEASDDTE
jgi:hypothetical protein